MPPEHAPDDREVLAARVEVLDERHRQQLLEPRILAPHPALQQRHRRPQRPAATAVNPDLTGQKPDELRHQQVRHHLPMPPHVPVENRIKPRHRTPKEPRKLPIREPRHAPAFVQAARQRRA